jgi:hypothetical protein
MSLISSINWLYTLSGFVVGALVGVTGVGGGSLMTPILILLFGIHPATAVGTDLLYAAATKTCGTFVHGFNRTIDWRIVGRLALGSVPMTAVTLFILSRVDFAGPMTGRLITLLLSAALLATSFALVFRTRRTTILTVTTGGALGVLVSISSVGAGALCVTALILLYPRLSTSRIIGSDIAHAVPLTLAAGVGHWIMGSIDAGILGSLLVGSIPGVVVGSSVAARVPDTVLRLTLATVLVIVVARLTF